jgi:hypothetical protein
LGKFNCELLAEMVHIKNQRVVKKPVLKIIEKKLKHRGTGIRMNPPVFMFLSTA